ncbi:MAG: hypothetical protein KGJ35_01495 [Patescibacteria group bacterium]|nr:hypothetical protein [Patescibacteria group bacterium]
MLLIANTHKDYKDTSVVKNLINSGVDVLRFNLSYGTKEENIEKISIARKVIKDSKKEVKIMADLPGNKIRIGRLTVDPLVVTKGDRLFFSGNDSLVCDVPILLSNIEKYVNIGDIITYKDGELAFSVIELLKNGFMAIALNTYEITSNKGINFQRAIDTLKHLTPKTIEQFKVINETKPDFVAFSFVNSKNSMTANKEALFKNIDKGYKPIIVGKIESELGVKNIEEIADECDWIMVARGDLALNTPFSRLGIYQKIITKKAKARGKNVIVATQVLDSLLSNHIPSRGDILDVTNIILDGNDGMMFSCTSSAKDPGEIIKAAKEIITATASVL